MDEQATQMLAKTVAGDPREGERLMLVVYEDLRRLAHRYLQQEREGHTLEATALVNEAFLKLIDQTRVDWRGRTHFFAVGAQAMRRVLVNHAKTKKRLKRGGGRNQVPLDEPLAVSADRADDVLALDEALERLAALDARQARIVELRFFGGLTVAEAAEVLGVSPRTIEREWTACRAWLRRELADQPEP
jgi:RNA polymerase sigma factor (TIGR02999 family)